MVDREDAKVIGMVEGYRAADLRRWFLDQHALWFETTEVVAATDLTESNRRGMAGASITACTWPIRSM